MTDSLSPLEANQTKQPFVSSRQPSLRQNLDFSPTAESGLALQINVGDVIAVRADEAADSSQAKKVRHTVVGRTQEGDLIVIEDARRKCGNGLEFRYILNLSELRELTIREKKYMTDGQEVLQKMPGLHNFRCCPELRVLTSGEVSLS